MTSDNPLIQAPPIKAPSPKPSPASNACASIGKRMAERAKRELVQDSARETV